MIRTIDRNTCTVIPLEFRGHSLHASMELVNVGSVGTGFDISGGLQNRTISFATVKYKFEQLIEGKDR